MLHHKNPKSFDLGFLWWTVQDENRAAARSAVSNQPSGLLLSPRFPIFRNVYQESTACRSTICRTSVGRDRTGTMYVRAIRKKQRQGIIVAMVSCLLLYGAFRGNRCVRRKKGKL